MGTNQSKLNVTNKILDDLNIKPSVEPVSNIPEVQNQNVQLQQRKSKVVVQEQQENDSDQSQNLNLTESLDENDRNPDTPDRIKQTPISKFHESISKQLRQNTDLYVLTPLKSINKRIFELDEYVWIHEDPTIYFRNYPIIFRKNNFHPIQCSTSQYLRNMIDERPNKKFVIFTSSKMAQAICNQFSELQQIRYIYILSMSQTENRPENLKQFYHKVIHSSSDISLLISKAQYFARSYEKNLYPAKFSKISEFQSDYKTRMKLKGLTQFSDKSQAKQNFMELVYYLFPESKYIKELESFQQEYTEQYSQDIILNWYTRDTFFYNFLNKILSFTKNIYILSYIRFPLERTFSAIKSIYEDTKHKTTFKSYKRCTLSEDEISSFVNNIGGFVQLFGFLSTSLNENKGKSQSGNVLIIIQVNKQERDKKIDYGYVNFNEFNLNDFNEDEILFNIFNVFKVLSVNRENQVVTIVLKYNQFSKLLKHYEISKLVKNSPEYLTDFQFKIVDKYAEHHQIIRKFKSQHDIIKACEQPCQDYEKLHHMKYITHTQLRHIQSKTKHLLHSKDTQPSQYQNVLMKHLENLKGFEIALIANIYNTIALYYKNQRNFPKALEYYENSLKIQIRNFGEEHLDIADTSYKIGSLYDSIHQYEKSMHFFKKSLLIYQKEYGSFNLKTIKTLHHVACLYQVKGFYEKALRLYKKVYSFQINAIGQQHQDTAKTLNNIGIVHCNQGNFDQALTFYQKAIVIYQKIGKSQSNELATTYLNIGKLYKTSKKFSEALTFFEKAYQLRSKINGSTNQSTLMIEKKIKQLKLSEKVEKD